MTAIIMGTEEEHKSFGTKKEVSFLNDIISKSWDTLRSRQF
jgi:hypothetical protein